jgi:hypothetical protein
MVGAQFAGVSNIVRGDVIGLQLAGFHNHTGRDLLAAQITSGVNRVDNHAYGMQIAGIASINKGDLIGLQISGLAGITMGDLIGVQISGIMGRADYISGVQIGFFNFGYSVLGAQIGLINIADDVTGTQIGLVNVSEIVYGDSVGLFTYSSEGQRHFEIWGDSTGFTHLGFRMGTSRVYTLLTAAYNPFSVPERWSYGLGLGGELPLDRFFINLDAAVHDHHLGFDGWHSAGGPSFIPEARALGGFSFATHFGMYVGGAAQFFIPGWYEEQTMSGYIPKGSNPDKLSIKWSILAGLRF